MKLRATSPHILAIILVASALPARPGVAQSSPPASIRNIVLVHGAWADGSSWEKIVPLLEAKGLHACVFKIR